MEDKISIIIPCYNNKSTIIESIDSVINQTYENYEIIIVDDGSTEDIKTKIDPYLSEKIYYFRQKNKGVSAARNFGVTKSTGNFLVFLDADDLIEMDYLKKCINEFKKNPNAKIVYSFAKKFGRENEVWNLPEYQNLKRLLIGNCIFVSAMVYKKDFEVAKGFDNSLKFYEDWDLWISILKLGGEVVQIPEYLFYYRTHDQLTSASDKAALNKKSHIENRLKIYVKHYETYEKHFGDFEQMFLTYVDMLKSKKRKSIMNFFC